MISINCPKLSNEEPWLPCPVCVMQLIDMGLYERCYLERLSSIIMQILLKRRFTLFKRSWMYKVSKNFDLWNLAYILFLGACPSAVWPTSCSTNLRTRVSDSPYSSIWTTKEVCKSCVNNRMPTRYENLIQMWYLALSQIRYHSVYTVNVNYGM